VEAKFRQAQKMEAIGQLTGGIAHDFNNLLGTMSTSLQVLDKRLQGGLVDGTERYIGMAQKSVRRAAALTQRLLAFSRQQTLDPRPTDVNRLIAGLEELIRRSVGPSVELEVVGAGGLWPTRIDAPQLENALLNLCINARDAMPEGGRLTIETANCWLDGHAAAERELPPGQYISICVTDTGTGMTERSRAAPSIRSSPPSRSAPAPGSACRWSTASCASPAARCGSIPSSASARRCASTCRATSAASSARPARARPGRRKAATAKACCWSRTRKPIRMLVAEELESLGYRVTRSATVRRR
jgi:hypothetical protein